MDKFKHDEQLGLTAVMAPANMCEEILSGSENYGIHCVHTQMMENENDKIVGNVDLGDFLHWRKSDEEEFQTLNKSSQKCTLYTNRHCNQRWKWRSCVSNVGASDQHKQGSVDCNLFLQIMK
jgi:hypothetical protein